MALAFVDDSGSGGDSQYYVLAGYVESEAVWSSFIPDWQGVLDLSPKLEYFKMSEAESLKGQFSGFTADERDARLGQFIDIVLKYSPWEASIVVSERDYRDILYPASLKAHSSPYYPLFFAMVTAMSGFYRWSGSSETVDFVFDQQDGIETKAQRLYHQFRGWYPSWRLGRIAFRSDKKVLPLQAADLIAWQTRRFMCSREGTRRELRRLHSIQPPFRTTLKRRDLQEAAEAMQRSIPRLREQFGDAEVDGHLKAMERRNRREAEKAKV